jgi:hypothetical protein
MRCCVLFLLFVSACASEGSQPPESTRCVKLRDHLVDLQVADIHVATGVDRNAHRRALAGALGDDFTATCTSKMSESQVDCALGANDAASAAACAR